MSRDQVEKDGTGAPLDDSADYYIQDRRTVIGNCVLWWRPEGKGYACDLLDAGIFKGSECRNKRDTDVPWPVEMIRRSVTVHVRAERLAEFREAARKQKEGQP